MLLPIRILSFAFESVYFRQYDHQYDNGIYEVIVEAQKGLRSLIRSHKFALTLNLALGAWACLLPFFVVVQPAFLLLGFGAGIMIVLRFVMSATEWRKMHEAWQQIHFASRRFGWQIITFFSFHFQRKIDLFEIDAFQNELMYRHIALVYLMGYHLRDEPHRLSDVINLLPDGEMDKIRHNDHLPMGLIHRQAVRLQDAYETGCIDENRYLQLEQTLQQLTQAFTVSEDLRRAQPGLIFAEINKYAVWVAPLAFGLAFQALPYFASIPAVLIISAVLFIMEKVTLGLDKPFTRSAFDIPVTYIARSVEIEIRQMMGEKSFPRPVKDINGVLF